MPYNYDTEDTENIYILAIFFDTVFVVVVCSVDKDISMLLYNSSVSTFMENSLFCYNDPHLTLKLYIVQCTILGVKS